MNNVKIIRNREIPPAPHVRVAIVGAGACGLTAAIRLRGLGIECVLLERDAVPRGSTALSSGLIPAAGTRLQKSLGIEDSAAAFAQDVQGKAHGDAPPHLVAAYTQAVAQAVDTLEHDHGIRFEVLDGFLYPGHHVRRMHAVPERTGAALMACLERAATTAGADILTDALVRVLYVDAADRILGLGYERRRAVPKGLAPQSAGRRYTSEPPDGTLEYLACDVLLLACNGFGGNPDMVREFLPAIRDATFAGHVGNDGSAISWGRQLGARLADMGAYQGHGSWAIPQGALMSWAVMVQGGIQVNAAGQRFHDETLGYSEAAVQVLNQPGGIAWNIFDAPLLALARSFPDFVEAQNAGALKSAPDLASLAQLLGCDTAVLRTTLAAVLPGPVDRFGRVFTRALDAPYYAVKVTGALFHTQGGLDIDAQCRVLRTDDTAFPNLLAAGGAARGVSGNAVWGYLSGNGLLSAVGGGWVAAGTISDQLAP